MLSHASIGILYHTGYLSTVPHLLMQAARAEAAAAMELVKVGL